MSTGSVAQVEHLSSARPRLLPRWSPQRVRLNLWAYAFLLPILALLVGFKLVPMLAALVLSLTSYDLLTPPRFVGLANYGTLLTDPRFGQSVGVTLYFMFGTAIPLWLLSLGLAVVFNRSFPGRGYLRLAYFLPTVMPTVVYAMVWRFLFHPYGLVNVGLQTLGLPTVNWLANASAVVPAFIVSTEWRLVPYFMIIFLAGLQTIPAELKEAAAIDGASAWQTFVHITLPLLRPTILLVMVVSLILLARNFTNSYLITGGGPDGASTVVGFFIFQAAFSQFRMGVASAASMLLLAGTMLLTVLQLRVFRDGRSA